MDKLKVFENKQIRAVWNDEQEDWCFSVVDVVAVLTDSKDYQASRNYWKVLKNRLKKEGSELVTNCNRLKLLSSDGKYYMQDVLNTAGVLRLVQSIPSPKAEPYRKAFGTNGNFPAKCYGQASVGNYAAQKRRRRLTLTLVNKNKSGAVAPLFC